MPSSDEAARTKHSIAQNVHSNAQQASNSFYNNWLLAKILWKPQYGREVLTTGNHRRQIQLRRRRIDPLRHLHHLLLRSRSGSPQLLLDWKRHRASPRSGAHAERSNCLYHNNYNDNVNRCFANCSSVGIIPTNVYQLHVKT